MFKKTSTSDEGRSVTQTCWGIKQCVVHGYESREYSRDDLGARGTLERYLQYAKSDCVDPAFR